MYKREQRQQARTAEPREFFDAVDGDAIVDDQLYKSRANQQRNQLQANDQQHQHERNQRVHAL